MWHKLSRPEENKKQLEFSVKKTDILELMNRYAGTHRRIILS